MSGPSPHSRRERLKAAIQNDELLLLPGVGDPLTARIAEEAGFDALFLSGAVVANSAFGYPDVGLTTFTEMVERANAITSAVHVPVFVDADTGYGNAMNVIRTTETYGRSNAAGIMLEDQVSPKRCGHFEGKRIIPLEEMMEKIVAFQHANEDHGLALIARTDAIAVEGFDEAVRRGQAYARAGVDLVFIESPRNDEELRAIPKLIDTPVLANMVEGGKTPVTPASELQAMGYSAVVYPSTAMRAAVRAMQHALATLREHGTSDPLNDVMIPWEERQRLVGLDAYGALEESIRTRARALMNT